MYRQFHEINRLEFRLPIYIGKAVPCGWRQGRIDESTSQELYRRLCNHTKSIAAAENLSKDDFLCRFMILENAASNLIGTVEAALIRHYRPLWNSVIDGFGNHDPGRADIIKYVLNGIPFILEGSGLLNVLNRLKPCLTYLKPSLTISLN